MFIKENDWLAQHSNLLPFDKDIEQNPKLFWKCWAQEAGNYIWMKGLIGVNNDVIREKEMSSAHS